MIASKPSKAGVPVIPFRAPSQIKLDLSHPAYRPKRNPVTIAVGFDYDHGLLLCADTKVTSNVKEHESKLVHLPSDDGNCSLTFAMSGEDLNFPRAAISQCWAYTRQINFGTASMEELRRALEFSLGEFYRDHIYNHPDRTPGRVFLELMIGVWLRGEKRLYLSHETVLKDVGEFECIGSGAYLAKYLIGQYRKAIKSNSLAFEDAALIARHAVQAAIDHDEYCGGSPEIIVVKSDGATDKKIGDMYFPNEGFVDALFELSWKLLRDMAVDRNMSLADNQIDEFAKQVKEIKLREEWRWA